MQENRAISQMIFPVYRKFQLKNLDEYYIKSYVCITPIHLIFIIDKDIRVSAQLSSQQIFCLGLGFFAYFYREVTSVTAAG